MRLPAKDDDEAPRGASSGLLRTGSRSGQIVGGAYRLLERIGSGAMGEVYAAEHLRLGRRVAVKILRAEQSRKAALRFRKEARAIALVESEYVVSVLDCGELDDDTPYFVLELLHGSDLRRLLDCAAPLPVPRAVNLLRDACYGVAAIHDAGLVHRDLKPANLFVSTHATGEDWCKVLDFGVAKLHPVSTTADGALIGTVPYMAPEQLQSPATVGPHADVYSLGAILYECLCGNPPHSAQSLQALMFEIINHEPRALTKLRPDIPPALARIVARCLSKAATERYADARALALALAPFARKVVAPRHAARDTTTHLESLDVAAIPKSGRKPRLLRLVYLVLALAFTATAVVFGTWRERNTRSPSAVVAPRQLVLAATAATAIADQTSGLRLPVIASTSSSAASPSASKSDSIASSKSQPSFASRKLPPPALPKTTMPDARFDMANPYSPQVSVHR